MGGVPRNWTQLREAVNARLEEDLRELKDEARRAALVLDRETPTLTAAFEGSPEYLARVFAVGGPNLARGACHLAAEALPRLLTHRDEPPGVAPTSAVSVLSYITMLRCLDVPLPPAAAGLEARWLPVIVSKPDQLTAYDARTAALAAVATGQVELVPALDEGGPLRPCRDAREVAGANVPGFTRQLAEAMAAGAGPDAVEGSWRAFLALFPLTVAADGVRWVDLVWAAVIIKVQFDRRPVGSVGIWLPALVKELD
jgi:hypothetical protein